MVAGGQQGDLTCILEKEIGFGNGLGVRWAEEGQRTIETASSVSGLSNGVAGDGINSEEEDRWGASLSGRLSGVSLDMTNPRCL